MKDENFFVNLSVLFAGVFAFSVSMGLTLSIQEVYQHISMEIQISSNALCVVLFMFLAYQAKKGKALKKWAVYILDTSYWGLTWAFVLGIPCTIFTDSFIPLIGCILVVPFFFAIRNLEELKKEESVE